VFTVCRADPLPGETTPGVTLHIDGSIDGSIDATPGPYETSDPYGRFYNDQASKIMNALASLPGGTFDALLIKMLDRKRSLLRVREP